MNNNLHELFIYIYKDIRRDKIRQQMIQMIAINTLNLKYSLF